MGRCRESDSEQFVEKLLEDNRLLVKALAEQKAQLERYSKELIQSEKALMKLKGQCKLLQDECSTLKAELKDMTNLKNSFETLYQGLTLERDAIFEKVMAEKNCLINELREELKAVNEQALTEVKTVSCNAHDELMLEKVNLINTQQKIIILTERVSQLTNILNEYRKEAEGILNK